LYSIFLVSDQEKGKDKEKKTPNFYPDLSDSEDGTSKGGEEEYSSMESEESEEKMPPRRPQSIKKNLLQL